MLEVLILKSIMQLPFGQNWKNFVMEKSASCLDSYNMLETALTATAQPGEELNLG